MAEECSDPLGGGRRHVYVSYGSWLEDFPLRTKCCCCCVGSDEEGSPRRCTEASVGREDRGSFSRGEEGAGGGGGTKSAAAGGRKSAPATKPAAPVPKKSSSGAKAGAAGAGKPPLGEPSKVRKVPSPARVDEAGARVADFDTDINVSDYFGGKFF
jgi:hypothetical protein